MVSFANSVSVRSHETRNYHIEHWCWNVTTLVETEDISERASREEPQRYINELIKPATTKIDGFLL